MYNTEGPRLTRILGLEKTTLCKIRVSGTVGGPLVTQKYRAGSGIRGSENCVSGGPPVVTGKLHKERGKIKPKIVVVESAVVEST